MLCVVLVLLLGLMGTIVIVSISIKVICARIVTWATGVASITRILSLCRVIAAREALLGSPSTRTIAHAPSLVL